MYTITKICSKDVIHGLQALLSFGSVSLQRAGAAARKGCASPGGHRDASPRTFVFSREGVYSPHVLFCFLPYFVYTHESAGAKEPYVARRPLRIRALAKSSSTIGTLRIQLVYMC